MQPASSHSLRCGALLILAAAIKLPLQSPAPKSSPGKQPDSLDSGPTAGQFWQSSSFRNLLPAALATAVVCQESSQELSEEDGLDSTDVLLPDLSCLLQNDLALVSAFVSALPAAAEVSRYFFCCHTINNRISNVSGPTAAASPRFSS